MIKLYRMDCLNTIKLLAVLTFVHATNGQTATVSASEAEASTNVSLTCTLTGGTANVIQWVDDSKSPADTIYSGSNRFSTEDKYLNFKVTSLSATESVMTIENAEVEDDGTYRCDIPTGTDDSIVIEVEAASNVTLTLTSIVTNNEDMYVATCDAVGGKPRETITWTLNAVAQIDGNEKTIVDTNPPATSPLSNTKSVFTFPATLENYRQTLVCQVSGHRITELDGQESKDLDIHSAPSDDIITMGFQFLNTSNQVRVSCDISEENQPDPRIRNYYIYFNGNLKYQFSTGVNFKDVLKTEYDLYTEFDCVAGNYLGNTTTFEPISTTTLTPTTTAALEGTSPVVDSGTPGIGPPGPNTAAIAGGVVGGIACIVIIVIAVLYCKKQESCCFEAAGSKSSGSSKKPAGSAVGSSNGSEKDKINKPEAAPRGQGSIQHTANNPGQELYALPERKQPAGGRGGDAPDRGSGPGQNEPPGMLYADLDLSSKAGHTEKHVPKNENDVVVYSSILV